MRGLGPLRARSQSRTAVLMAFLLFAGLGVGSGCGTTVPPGPDAAGAGAGFRSSLGSAPTAGDQPASSRSGGPQPDSSTVTTSVPGGSVQDGGVGSSVQPSVSAVPGRVGARPTPAGTSGPGFDAHHVYIGITVQENSQSAAVDLGLGVTTGDPQAQAQAVIDAINAAGGVMGRTLVPVYFNAAEGDNPQSTAQSACDDWTQDHKVFAVANVIAEIANSVLYACLSHAGVPFTSDVLDPPTVDSSFAAYGPYWWAPGVMDWGHFAPLLVHALSSEGYFGGWNATTGTPDSSPAKLGLLTVDDPSYRQAAQQLSDALAAAGYHFAQTFYMDVASESEAASTAQSAMLKFDSDGVTHVFSIGSEALFGMLAANSNQYRPRWEVNTDMAPGGLLEATIPAVELRGALGAGWNPSEDVDSAHDPGDVGAGETRCRQLMQAAGQASSRLALAAGYLYCDAIYALVDAAVVSGGFSVDDIQSGIESNRLFDAASTFSSQFASDRHASAQAIRYIAYGAGCSCFAYSSTEDHYG